MGKYVKRAIRHTPTFIIIVTLITLLTSCRVDGGSGSNTDNPGFNETGEPSRGTNTAGWSATMAFDLPEFLYLTESVGFPALPNDASRIRNIVITDNLIFFSARNPSGYLLSNEQSELQVHEWNDHVYSLDITTMEITKLQGFTPTINMGGATAGEGEITFVFDDSHTQVRRETIYFILGLDIPQYGLIRGDGRILIR